MGVGDWLAQIFLGAQGPKGNLPAYTNKQNKAETSEEILKRLTQNKKQLGGDAYNKYWNDPNRIPYGGQMGSTAAMEAYERQKQLDNMQQPQPGLGDTILQQLLQGINSGQPKIRSTADLTKEASKNIGLQYDPQIAAIKDIMAGARSDSKANSKEIQALYNSLAGSYKEDAAWFKKELGAAKQGEAKSLDALQGRVDTQYADQTADMAAEFQKLGITDALPEATEGMRGDIDFISQLNNTQSEAQQNYYDSLGASNANYFSTAPGIARQYGVESSERLLGNLEAYLREQRGQLAGIQGQKASGIAQLVSQMQQAQNQGASDYDNTRWERMAQILGLVNSRENSDFDRQITLMKLAQAQQNGGAEAKNGATKGIQGAYDVLQQLLGQNAPQGMSALQNFLQTTTQREGTFEGENGQPNQMTPQQAAYEARKYATTLGLGAAETDALIQAVYAYYGKLR